MQSCAPLFCASVVHMDPVRDNEGGGIANCLTLGVEQLDN